MPGDEDHYPRPTTASIDRRVERLEAQSTEMRLMIDRLDLGQAHLRELINARFATIDQQFNAQNGKIDAIDRKLDGFMDKIDSLITKAMEQAGDIRATPLGRQVDDGLKMLEEGRQSNGNRITALEKTVWRVSAVLISLMAVLTFFSPFINAALKAAFHIQ